MRMSRGCDSECYILHDDYCLYPNCAFIPKLSCLCYFLLVNNSRDLEEQARHTAPFLKLRWQTA